MTCLDEPRRDLRYWCTSLQVIESSNYFRRVHCYNESTSDCLRSHLPACLTLFTRHALSVSVGGPQAAPEAVRLLRMTMGGWLAFIEAMGLVASGELTWPQSRCAWMSMSRMLII